jgi:S1-C subfamily serine protease
MSSMTDLSNALGDTVARAATGVLPIHQGSHGVTTGIVFDEHHLVTAARGVEPDAPLEVALGAERVPATFVGADPASDLAVLRVERTLTPLPQADDALLRTGHLVVAVSQGSRGTRARLGIVSRVGGSWHLSGGLRLPRYFETDIAPTPELSGSALVDAGGALVCINVVGPVRGSLVTLPLAALTSVVKAIAEHGRVRRAKLGVALQRVELPAKAAARLGARQGLIVLGLAEGGPAEQAGVLVGDILLAVGGTKVERVEELQALLDESKIDAETNLELHRAGAEATLTLRPVAR